MSHDRATSDPDDRVGSDEQSPVDAARHDVQSPVDAARHDEQSPVDAARHDVQSPVDAARHDVEAFAALYREHVDAIYRFALRRTGSVPAAEDATSATFEKALAKLDRYDARKGAFGPWLHAIAAREIADQYRRRARHETERAQGVLGRFHQPTVAAHETDPVAADALRNAIASLSPRHQQAISLRYFADLDNDAAAAALGTTKAAFAVTLHRAKAALRKALVSRGIDTEALR